MSNPQKNAPPMGMPPGRHGGPPMKMPPPNRHGGTPVRMKGEKIDFKVLGRIFSYLSLKHRLLLLVVVLCIVVSSLASS